MGYWVGIRNAFTCMVSEKRLCVEVFDGTICFQIIDGSGLREVVIQRSEFEPFIIQALRDTKTLARINK